MNSGWAAVSGTVPVARNVRPESAGTEASALRDASERVHAGRVFHRCGLADRRWLDPDRAMKLVVGVELEVSPERCAPMELRDLRNVGAARKDLNGERTWRKASERIQAVGVRRCLTRPFETCALQNYERVGESLAGVLPSDHPGDHSRVAPCLGGARTQHEHANPNHTHPPRFPTPRHFLGSLHRNGSRRSELQPVTRLSHRTRGASAMSWGRANGW